MFLLSFIFQKQDIMKSKTNSGSRRRDMLLTSVGTLGVPYVVKDETFYFKDGNLTWFGNLRDSIVNSYTIGFVSYGKNTQ